MPVVTSQAAGEPSRVLHVIDHTGTGGAQVVVEYLVRVLARTFSFGVAVLGRAGPFSDAYRELGAHVFDLGESHGRWSVLPLLGLIGVMRRGEYDLVHTHLYRSNVLGIVAAKWVGCKAILHDHSDTSTQSLSVHRWLPNPLVRIVYLFAYRRALDLSDRVAVLTARMRDHYRETYSVAPDRICVVPNAVDLQHLARIPKARSKGWLRTELGVSPSASLVAMVGRLEPQKDWETFLQVARRVGARLGPSCVFVAVGSGSLDSRLRRLTRELEVGNVIFLGHRDDVPGILREADAFLLTSRHEPFGIVLLEAMGTGCPVIATRSGGPATILSHGEDGLLAGVGDADTLASQVIRVLQDVTLRERLIRKARRTVVERYSVEAVSASIASIYYELMG
jgi:glycosyltransferase involved in cell wall biosynthesis